MKCGENKQCSKSKKKYKTGVEQTWSPTENRGIE